MQQKVPELTYADDIVRLADNEIYLKRLANVWQRSDESVSEI